MVFTDKPGAPVGPLHFTEITETSVSFSWKPPESDGGKPIRNYIIEKREVSKNVWTSITSVDSETLICQATKLRTGQMYTFRVAAENEIGVGPYLESIEPIAPQKKICKAYSIF